MTRWPNRLHLTVAVLMASCARNQSLGPLKDGGDDAQDQKVVSDLPSDKLGIIDQSNASEVAEDSPGATPDGPAIIDQEDDVGSPDAASPIVPQCLGRHDGDKFCMGSEVYQCNSNLTSITLFMTCLAPKPTCVGGVCGACTPNVTRSCSEDGLAGPCAKGTETCTDGGTWGSCSIPPELADTCEAGNDNNCNGKTNDNCVPQCIGRQVGDKFCIGTDVYQCGPNLMSMTSVMTCVAPKPACMGGVCGTCLPNTTRSCAEDGLKGPCAKGMETCSGAGTWGACSIPPGTTDTCDRDNDDNCNGRLNENCICINGEQKTCAVALGKKGACGLDTATCVNGQWTGCTDSKGTDTCVRDNDNSCNGKPNEDCICINGDTGKCGDKLGAKGMCAGGTTTCASGQWGICDRQPKATDTCVFGNDDMCTGAPVGSPGNTQCQCGGFTMPNPASAGLPNPASYKNNGDGTVTDNVTSLVWERTASASTYTQASAINYCLAKGPGWRLPTRLELVSLIDFTIPYPGPTINAVFGSTPANEYWTSSALADSSPTPSAWFVRFDFGETFYASVVASFRARCVSGGIAAPKCYRGRYQTMVPGQIYDASTDLTWQQDVGTTLYDWMHAITHCSNGWRLPSLTELQTIVDDTKRHPSIDPSTFPNTPKGFFWTSSPVAGEADEAWPVTFDDGYSERLSDWSGTNYAYPARCVR